MPITINGTGTITGITAGGLPDAIITQPELATNVAGTGPAFSAYQSTLQSVSIGVYTKVQLQTEEFDTNSNFDSTTNYRFTPTVAGYYQINGCVTAPSAAGGAYFIPAIYKNGSVYKIGFISTAAGPYQASVNSLVYLNGSTDYVELYVQQNYSTAVNTSTGISSTYFNGSMARGA